MSKFLWNWSLFPTQLRVSIRLLDSPDLTPKNKKSVWLRTLFDILPWSIDSLYYALRITWIWAHFDHGEWLYDGWKYHSWINALLAYGMPYLGGLSKHTFGPTQGSVASMQPIMSCKLHPLRPIAGRTKRNTLCAQSRYLVSCKWSRPSPEDLCLRNLQTDCYHNDDEENRRLISSSVALLSTRHCSTNSSWAGALLFPERTIDRRLPSRSNQSTGPVYCHKWCVVSLNSSFSFQPIARSYWKPQKFRFRAEKSHWFRSTEQTLPSFLRLTYLQILHTFRICL